MTNNILRRLFGLVSVAVLAGLPACGFDPLAPLGDFQDDGSPAAAQRMAAEDGGAVERGGVSFSVPPSGLSSDTTITIEPTSVPVAPATGFASAPVEVGPSGTVFTTAADISFAFDPTKVNVQGVQVVYYDPRTGAWQPVPTTVDLDANTASAPLAHLSTYALADGDSSELDLLDNTGDLFVRVHSGERGQYLAGALVRIVQVDGTGYEAETDETGTASFTGLPIGTYLLSVSADGHEPAQRDIQVTAEAAASVEIVLVRKADPVGGIAGQVSGKDPASGETKPIEGAYLALLAPVKPVNDLAAWAAAVLHRNADSSWAHPDAVLVAVARTNAEGRYELAKVPAGRYLLVAKAIGFESAHALLEVIAGQDTLKDFTLAAIALPATGSVYGRVLGKSAAGAEPLPLAGALVRALAADAPDLAVGDAAKTDEQGRYLIADLPAGAYLIVAVAEGYRPGTAKALVQAGQRTRADIVLAAEIIATTGTIAGKVFGPDGLPAKGALLTLRSPLADGVVAETISGEDGGFKFEEVREGAYVLQAVLGGIRSEPVRVKVLAGQTVQVHLKLLQPPVTKGAIAGLVMSATAHPVQNVEPFVGVPIRPPGTAADEPKPIEGARLLLSNLNGEKLAETTTDAKGAYAFKDLAPGYYLLAVDAGELGHAARHVKVEAGKTTRADFVLLVKPAPAAAVLQGKVSAAFQAAGNLVLRPIPGAKVSVWKPGANTPAGSATTGDDGAYKIEGLTEGPALVVAEADGFHPFRGTATLKPGENTLDIQLKPKPSFGAVAGRVTNKEGKAIAGAQVHLIGRPLMVPVNLNAGTGGGDEAVKLRYALTDADGRYAMKEVPVGHYTLSVQAAHYVGATKEIDVALGELTQADFVLEPAPGKVAGKVYLRGATSTGEVLPAVGASVKLSRDNQVVASTETDVQGAFHFDGLNPGGYLLSVSLAGYLTERRTLTVAAGETTRVSLALTAEPGKGGLLVKVGAADGSANALPLEGATVLVRHAGQVVAEGRTDAQGLAEFKELLAGEYSVLARKDGYLPAEGLAKVEKGQTATLSLLLKKPLLFGAIAGFVGARDGDHVKPLAGALVALAPADLVSTTGTVPSRTALTNNEGRFRFDQLVPGAYKLLVELQGYVPARASAVVEAGKVAELKILLQAVAPPAPTVGGLMGIVRGASPSAGAAGLPIAGATLVLANASAASTQPRITTTNLDGYYAFRDVPAGHYLLGIKADKFKPLQLELDIAAGAPTVKDFVLEPEPPPPPATGAIAGKVLAYIQGNPPVPLAGALVGLHRAGSVIKTAVSGPEGGFLFPELEPGDYMLKAMKDGFQPSNDVPAKAVAGEVSTATIVLVAVPTTGGLAGLVLGGGPAGTAPKPLPGAQLALRGAVLTIIFQAESDALGRYAFKDIPAGPYVVAVRATGFKVLEQPVEIVAGIPMVRDFILEPEPPPPPARGAIAGKVNTAAPNGDLLPLAGAKLELYKGTLAPIAVKTSGTDGGFLFEGLEPGDYALIASKDGFLPLEKHLAVTAGQTTFETFTLLAKPPLTGGIKGIVRGAGSTPGTVGGPIAGAVLSLSGGNSAGTQALTATTNIDGYYALLGVPAGHYLLSIRASGFKALQLELDIAAGDPAIRDFLLEPEPPMPPAKGGIAGKVQSYATGGNFTAIAGATVGLHKNGAILATKTSGTDGGFAFGELEPGDYMVKAMKDGYNPSGEMTVTVKSGETATANLVLIPKVGTVSGTVAKAGSTPNLMPVSGAVVKLLDSAGQVKAETRTGTDGRFNFFQAPVGSYTVRAVYAPDTATQWSGTATVHVMADQITTVSIELKESGQP